MIPNVDDDIKRKNPNANLAPNHQQQSLFVIRSKVISNVKDDIQRKTPNANLAPDHTTQSVTLSA